MNVHQLIEFMDFTMNVNNNYLFIKLQKNIFMIN